MFCEEKIMTEIEEAAIELFDNLFDHSHMFVPQSKEWREEKDPRANRELCAKLGAAIYGLNDPRVKKLI